MNEQGMYLSWIQVLSPLPQGAPQSARADKERSREDRGYSAVIIWLYTVRRQTHRPMWAVISSDAGRKSKMGVPTCRLRLAPCEADGQE